MRTALRMRTTSQQSLHPSGRCFSRTAAACLARMQLRSWKPGALALAALLLLTGSALVASSLVVTAGRVKGHIKLDGVLDEPAWRGAGVIENLTQQEPYPGQPTPFHTKVLVLVDDANLYIGFLCHDPDPRRIAVHTLQRDAEMRGDDTVGVVLDTFGDRRRGYFFRINAAGARQDAGAICPAAVVTFTTSGSTSLRAARERPPVSILCLTPSQATARQLAPAWGIHAVVTADATDLDDMVEKAERLAKEEGFAKSGDRLVITAGIPFGTPGATNLLRIAWVE